VSAESAGRPARSTQSAEQMFWLRIGRVASNGCAPFCNFCRVIFHQGNTDRTYIANCHRGEIIHASWGKQYEIRLLSNPDDGAEPQSQ